MRIVFTGGGTGGHVFPNVAVIRELRERRTGEVFYIGEKGGPEEEFVRKYHVPFYGIHSGKLRRYFDVRNFIDFFKIPLGFFEALKILRKLKPNLVFAKGGYVSVPVVMAAWVLRIPSWLHESDVSPGLANRICSRFAKKIWLSFEESGKYFKGLAAARLVVGNPIRKEIFHGSAKKGYQLTGFSPKRPTILVMGGSSGAQYLNQLVFKMLPKLLQKVQVVHITGVIASEAKQSRDPSPLARDGALAPDCFVGLRPPRNDKNYKVFEFLHADLAHIYAITDLAVSRAGSGGIFELLALKKPMILIPLPRAASRGDQIENACAFEKHGWARALDQNTFTPQDLLKNILELLTNKKMRSRMIQSQKQAHFEDAAQRIAAAIKNL